MYLSRRGGNSRKCQLIHNDKKGDQRWPRAVDKGRNGLQRNRRNLLAVIEIVSILTVAVAPRVPASEFIKSHIEIDTMYCM